jgi:hypothetical protein
MPHHSHYRSLSEGSAGVTLCRKQNYCNISAVKFRSKPFLLPSNLVSKLGHFIRAQVGHFSRAPRGEGGKKCHTYQVYLIKQKGASWSMLNQTVCGLCFVYRITLGKERAIQHIPAPKKEVKLPSCSARTTSRASSRVFPTSITGPHSHDRLCRRLASLRSCLATCRHRFAEDDHPDRTRKGAERL